MNLVTVKLASLAAICSFSAATMAAVAVKPRPRVEGVRPGAPAVEAAPTVKSQAVDSKFNMLNEAANDNQPQQTPNQCDPRVANTLTAGTNVTPALAEDLIAKNVVKLGSDCGKKLAQYSPDAREVLFQTADCSSREGVLQVASVSGRDQIHGGCMLKVKSAKGVETNLQKEVANANEIRTNCDLLH